MTREFAWRRSASRNFLIVVGGAAFVALASFTMIVTSLGQSGSFSDWIGFPFFCSVILLSYLLPRILGVLRNRMTVTITDEGLVTPLGRRVPVSTLQASQILSESQRPHWVRFGGIIPVRIFLDFYEKPDELFRCLKGFRDLGSEQVPAQTSRTN